MPSPKTEKPYFEAWLRRTCRQFAASGRLTQTAAALAAEQGGTVDEWRARLRILVEGEEIPSLDLLMRIDAILAGNFKQGDQGDDSQVSLF
ncbi:MAG: hypothetical protein WED15_01950 [Akkermansiaceae bacterium]